MTYTLCSIVSSSYLPKLLAFVRSLAMCGDATFEIWIACMDDESQRVLSELRTHFGKISLRPIPLRDITGWQEAVTADSALQRCWSLKPHLLLHVLAQVQQPAVLYLDADMYALSQRFVEMYRTSYEALLAPHGDHDYERVPDLANLHVRFGAINSGCILFKNSERSKQMLRWVCQCLDVPRRQFAPAERILMSQSFLKQEYREQHAFSALYYMHDEVGFIDDPGINLGPWRLHGLLADANGRISVRGNGERYYPLSLFHVHGVEVDEAMKVVRRNMTNQVWDDPIVRGLYDGWLRLYRQSVDLLRQLDADLSS
jgi:hypothetical protein